MKKLILIFNVLFILTNFSYAGENKDATEQASPLYHSLRLTLDGMLFTMANINLYYRWKSTKVLKNKFSALKEMKELNETTMRNYTKIINELDRATGLSYKGLKQREQLLAQLDKIQRLVIEGKADKVEKILRVRIDFMDDVFANQLDDVNTFIRDMKINLERTKSGVIGPQTMSTVQNIMARKDGDLAISHGKLLKKIERYKYNIESKTKSLRNWKVVTFLFNAYLVGDATYRIWKLQKAQFVNNVTVNKKASLGPGSPKFAKLDNEGSSEGQEDGSDFEEMDK